MRAFHFCVPSPTGNFGDDALFVATRRVFEQLGVREWGCFNLREHVTPQVVSEANRFDLVVVGGGGLFLKDTNPNSVSGWQWKCPIDLLGEFRKPLIIFAVGYNRFRGQEPFDEVFRRHVGRLVEVASHFSVRNGGSREALQREGIEVRRVKVCPCPSLFLRPRSEPLLDGNVARSAGSGPKRVAVQLAGDRLSLRLRDADKFYRDLAEALRRLEGAGYEVHFVEHNWRPESNMAEFRNRFAAPVHDISHVWSEADLDAALRLYRSFDVVIAMRGHGQMVPFGQGVPVVSLVTHDKLRWFLRDVGMEETAVEAEEPGMGRMLAEKVRWLAESDWWRRRWPEAYADLKERAAATLKEIAGVL